jgi:hypothetical protein
MNPCASGWQPSDGNTAGYGVVGSVVMNSSSRMQLVVFVPMSSGAPCVLPLATQASYSAFVQSW